MNGVDVAGYAADEISCTAVVVVCQREPLHVIVKGRSKAVSDLLSNAGSQNILEV